MAFPRKRKCSFGRDVACDLVRIGRLGTGSERKRGDWATDMQQVDEYINSHLYNYLFYDTENILNHITIYNV